MRVPYFMNRSDLFPLKRFAAPGFLQTTHRYSFAMRRRKSRFSKQQTCRLLSQIERCAVYASGSGVEAWNRRSTNDILRHVSFANGSSDELCFFLILTTVLHTVRKEKSPNQTQAPTGKQP